MEEQAQAGHYVLSAWHQQKVFGASKEVIISAGVFLSISGSASSVGGEGVGWADFLLWSPHHPPWTLREGSEAPRRCRRWQFGELMKVCNSGLVACSLYMILSEIAKQCASALQHPPRKDESAFFISYFNIT